MTHTHSSKCYESRASAETLFSHQNVMSAVFDRFRSRDVPRYDCTGSWLMNRSFAFPELEATSPSSAI